MFSSHWQPFNFGWSNCLSLKHVSWLLSFSILPNIFRILAILFQKLAKTGGLEWLSHYNCTSHCACSLFRTKTTKSPHHASSFSVFQDSTNVHHCHLQPLSFLCTFDSKSLAIVALKESRTNNSEARESGDARRA